MGEIRVERFFISPIAKRWGSTAEGWAERPAAYPSVSDLISITNRYFTSPLSMRS
jgi:hypothetical protein